MPDITLTITIPQAKATEAIEAFVSQYPNITTDPLQWRGSKMTDRQWMKYRIRMWIDEQINTGRRHVYRVNNPEPVDSDFTA